MYGTVSHSVSKCQLWILLLGKGNPAVLEVHGSLSCEGKASGEQLITEFLTG